MELTVQERLEKIRELASEDISVVANVIVDGTVKEKVGVNACIVYGNEISGKASVEVVNDYDIPTDTEKYDIIQTEYGIRWKLKD